MNKPEQIPTDMEEVENMHVGEQSFGNALRQALIIQHFM